MKKILRIDQSWGRVEVFYSDMTHEIFKDCVIRADGSAIEWDWKINGTRHNPGIQKEDLDFFNKGSETLDAIILTRGVNGVLEIPLETIDYADEMAIDIFMSQTPEAVKTFNALIKEGKRVAALIHSTC